MGETELVETADPEEAFAALADGTRVAILQALWDADESLAFSALREAVGVRDSGQFNYHLDKLVGRFVRKTDDGYELTLAGQQVNGAIHAGAYTMAGSIDPMKLGEPCPACGDTLTFRYENDEVLVDCDGCSIRIQGGVPPSVFAGHERDAAPALTARYMRTIFEHVGNGFCWYCDGRVRPAVFDVADQEEAPDDPDERIDGLPLVEYTCQRCGAEVTGDLGSSLLDRPPVVAFHHDHGVDVHERPYWEFAAMNTDRARIREEDPLRATVTYEAGDERLRVVVDEDLDVLETERLGD